MQRLSESCSTTRIVFSLTTDQLDWLEDQMIAGKSRSEVIRECIQFFIDVGAPPDAH